MIVLDTNIISETMRLKPNGAVIAWLDDQVPSDLYLCAPVLAELYYGIARLEESGRKPALRKRCREMLTQVFDGRMLDFDAAAAERAMGFSWPSARRREIQSASWMP